MKIEIRNIIYWLKRLTRKYKTITLDFDKDEDIINIYEAAHLENMTVDQFVEMCLWKYIKTIKGEQK